eukprot:11366643-Ditylum_brightwellii.AAC.1
MDKTNSYAIMKLEKYINWVKKHLEKTDMEISRAEIVNLHVEAKKFAASFLDLLSKGEKAFLQEGLDSKAIPQPQLLIKDHKDWKQDGDYPARSVIPATNFTATFSKIGYLIIKKVLGNAGIICNKHTIIQLSNLKEKLEKFNLTSDKVTVMSLDIEFMYPSIRVRLIKKALNFYTRNLSKEEKKRVQNGMKLIQHGMKSTLVGFRDK